MYSKAAEEFGILSQKKVEENLRFVEKMEIHGRKIKVPCRSGMQERLFMNQPKREQHLLFSKFMEDVFPRDMWRITTVCELG